MGELSGRDASCLNILQDPVKIGNIEQKIVCDFFWIALWVKKDFNALRPWRQFGPQI